MKATFLKGVALGSAVSLVTLAATAAFAGTGVGKVFNLGEDNRANARSQLEGSTPSAVLRVANSNKSSSASGVAIDVPGSNPPLVVNSTTKVKNLNADLLDGHDASQFQASTSQDCLQGSAIASVSPTGATTCTTSAVWGIDHHSPPTGELFTFEHEPATFGVSFDCAQSRIQLFNFASAPANVSYSYIETGGTPAVGNQDLLQDIPFTIPVPTLLVGQFVYFDQTTVSTITVSFANDGANGCDDHGNVEEALRS